MPRGCPTTSRTNDAPVLPFAQPSAPPDALRAMLSQLIHDVLETEFAGVVGAARYERTAERRGVRNGYRTRRLTTRVGALELRIPRDRAGQFQPSLFTRSQRSEQALVAALAEMYERTRAGRQHAEGERRR